MLPRLGSTPQGSSLGTNEEIRLAPEQNRELLDLTAVHRFYVRLIEASLGHEVPMPEEITAAAAGGRAASGSTELLKRWLALLDMSITPPMVRDALREATTMETAEALLRYLIRKQSLRENDRDKTDFVATSLCRKLAGAPGTGDVARRFEKALEQVLAGLQIPDPPSEHRRLINEFEFLQQEVEEFRHFDELMDSGVMQRVRDVKTSLQQSFYHPYALSTIAAYNLFFGERFDTLFREATQQIKAFAAKVQEQGASSLSRVTDEVTVKHLEDLQEHQALKLEYGQAKEEFRKVSRYKKAVDSRSPTKFAGGAQPLTSPSTVRAAAQAAESAAETFIATKVSTRIEEAKVASMAETICNFVKGTDSKGSLAVPLPHGSVLLSATEVDACRADYRHEKSFRADFANAIINMMAVYARMAAELKDYREKKSSSQYLWKPHADSLAFLLTAANKALQDSASILQMARDRGLNDKAAALQGSLEKLRNQVEQVATALQA